MAAPVPASVGTRLAGASSGTAAIPVPSGVASGDIIYVLLYLEADRAVTAPSGFTLLGGANQATGNHWSYVYWKRATAADSGTYSFTFTSTFREGVALRVAGALASGDPNDVFTKAGRASNGTVTPAVSVTTTGEDRLLIWFATDFSTGSWTPPTAGGTWTERVDDGTEVAIATKAQAAAGSTGSVTGSSTGNNHQTAWLVAVTPAVTTVTHDAAASFAGAGALSVTGLATRQVTATFAGSGALTVATRQTHAAAASFAGAGSLVAGSGVDRPASAAFAGAGSLTAGGTRIHPAAASFAGAGQMVSTPGQLGSAAFAGSGSMTATTRQTHQAAASFSGTGQLTVAGQSNQRIAAAFAGAGAMTVAGTPVRPANATFAGAGQMVTDGRRVHPATWAAAGAGALFVDPTRIRPAGAAFAGAGRMQVAARLDKPGLNLSLWAVTGIGVLAPLPAFENLELSRERNGVGAVRVDYPAAGAGFSHLRAAVDDDRPVEVEMWLGGSQEGALRARLTQTEGDDLDGRAVWTFTGTFLEGDLADGVVYPQPAPAEKGELRFDGKNAGQVILTVLQQVQARGALVSVTRDWTTTLDSSGQAWPNTISGLKYSPKTSLLAILQDLVEKDFCEFELTAGRVLRLWAPGTRGTDRTTGAAPTLFRYGRISSSPLRHSTRDTVTAVLAIGADGLSATAVDASAEARIGRRIEVGVDAGNIDNQAALQAYAQAALAYLTKGQEEIRHPLTFGPGDPRPLAGYDLADKVLSERAGGTRRAVDVQQWTLTASRQRVIEGEVILNDLIASRLQRLQRQLDRLGSGGAVIGTSNPPVENTLAPAAPTGITVDSLAYTEGIDTYATLIVGWAVVNTNSDGSAADDVAGYRVQWRPQSEGVDSWRLGIDVAGGTVTSTSFGGVGAGIDVLVRVAAYDRDGNQSAWSSEVVILTATDDTAPPTPSTPGAFPYLGQIKVTYDGKGSAGEAMPLDTDVIELHKSLASGFTPTDATAVDTFSPNIGGERVLTDLAYGVTVFVRLVARDRAGNRSAASAQASATPEKVVQIDIGPNAIGRSQIIDLEVITAKIDNLAVNDAKFGSGSFGKLTAGTISVAVTNAGIIRSGTSGQRYELDAAALRFYNSSGTQTVQLNGALNWILGELRTGLSGTRLVANPNGTNPDRIDFYPSSGSAKAMLQTRTFVGQALIDMIGGTTRSDGHTGQAGAHPEEGYVRWGEPESTTPNTAWIARRLEAVAQGGSIKLFVNQSAPNVDGGVRRISFERHSSPGTVISNSILWLQWNGSNQPWLQGVSTNSGVVFQSNAIGIVDGSGNAQTLVCSSVSEISSEEAKGDVRDARAVLDPLRVIRNSRSQAFEYLADRWRTPAPTEDNPDPEPVPVPPEEVPTRFGPIAEALPPELQESITLANGTTVLGTSLNAKVGVIWGALGQMQDQEIRTVAGRASLPNGTYQSGAVTLVDVEWDEPPLAVPTGGIVTVYAAIAWLGKTTAKIVPGSITAAGCTVEVRALGVVAPNVANPITVEAQALYLWSPPFNPEESP